MAETEAVGIVYHVVKSADESLEHIAIQHDVKISALKRFNRLATPIFLSPGQKLIVKKPHKEGSSCSGTGSTSGSDAGSRNASVDSESAKPIVVSEADRASSNSLNSIGVAFPTTSADDAASASSSLGANDSWTAISSRGAIETETEAECSSHEPHTPPSVFGSFIGAMKSFSRSLRGKSPAPPGEEDGVLVSDDPVPDEGDRQAVCKHDRNSDAFAALDEDSVLPEYSTYQIVDAPGSSSSTGDDAKHQLEEQTQRDRMKSVSVEDKLVLESAGDILTPARALKLSSCVPLVQRIEPMYLVYSLLHHGADLQSFYSKCASFKPTVLMVETTDGDVFGGYATAEWTPNKSFYGTGESFVFSFGSPGLDADPSFPAEGSVCAYPWTTENDFFQWSDESQISMGGGGDGFAFLLSRDFNDGTSGSCATFGNQPLASLNVKNNANGPFCIRNIEVWSFSKPRSPSKNVRSPRSGSKNISGYKR